MRYLYFSLVFFISACVGEGTSVLPSHTGAINEVVIVIDDPIWYGASGDSLRQSLSTEVAGISWSEPLFDVIQINSTAFSRIFKTHRNLIIVQKGQQSKVYFDTKTYAQNQWLCIVEYQTVEDLPRLFGQYAPIMAYQIGQKEHERYMKILPPKKQYEALSKDFNLNFGLPNDYKLVLDTNHFYWFEFNPPDKEIIKGVFVYEYPITSTFNSNTILSARDSVLQQFVFGSSEGSYMTTERLYPPYISTYTHNTLEGLKVKGLWKMQNAFMGGAFVSHFLNDTINDRILVIEGFLFNPGEDKRNSLQELEWLISDFKTQSSD
ncbi:MAG: DUF4837 family protein [Bacteroidota bacterium]|nr:DUF4837 family protein [Bacteroidota bacterium]